MSDILNDASVVANSRDVTINGVIYTATNITFDEENTVITRRDKNNIVSGRKVIRSEQTGSMTLQLATTTTVMPPARVAFAMTDMNGVAAQNFYLTKVGRQETNAGETTVPVSFCLAIGAIVTS